MAVSLRRCIQVDAGPGSLRPPSSHRTLGMRYAAVGSSAREHPGRGARIASIPVASASTDLQRLVVGNDPTVRPSPVYLKGGAPPFDSPRSTCSLDDLHVLLSVKLSSSPRDCYHPPPSWPPASRIPSTSPPPCSCPRPLAHLLGRPPLARGCQTRCSVLTRAHDASPVAPSGLVSRHAKNERPSHHDARS